jgi:hypothetical protein
MNVKTLLLSGAALVAFSATAALASPPQVSGNVGVFVGADWTNLDVSTSTLWQGDDTVFIFGGDAHVNAWLARDMSIQLDVQSESTTSIYQGDNGDGVWDGRSGGIIGAHLSWRDPQSHLIGLFGGFSGQSNLTYDGTMTNAIIGAEGQYYCDHVTLYGQVGYVALMSDSDEYEPKGILFARAVGRYFWTSNDRLQADLSYGGSDLKDNQYGASARYWNFGLSWQHRYEDSPFSTTIAYTGFWGNSDGSSGLNNDVSEQAVTVALNIHFGSGSLQQADREGETLDMPDFNRGEAWSYWLGYVD